MCHLSCLLNQLEMEMFRKGQYCYFLRKVMNSIQINIKQKIFGQS